MNKARKFRGMDDGNVIIMFGISFIPIIIATGIAADYGYSRYVETQVHAAGDMGVLAAAATRAAGGGDDSETIAYGTKVFTENKPGKGGGSDATSSITWDDNVVTLIAQANVASPFLKIINNASIPIYTVSKAAYGPPTKACIVALNQTAEEAVKIHGGSALDAEKCAVWSNSNSNLSMFQDGSSTAKAAGFCAHGKAIGTFAPKARSRCTRVSDPFETLTVADYSTLKCDVNKNTRISKKDGPTTLASGVYCGDIDIQTSASVILAPGTFHIIGQLIVRSYATVTGAETVDGGNTLVFYGPDGGFYTNGAGKISLNAPPSGDPYAGMAIVGDGENVGYENTMNGGAGVDIVGSIYVPNQSFKVAGSIEVNVDATDFTIVADTVTVGGSSNLNVVAENDVSSLPGSTPIMTGEVILLE
ncbi:MAG: TadE/TadG family type IV pilus assembly protein [Hyphomicrobiales bacterium]